MSAKYIGVAAESLASGDVLVVQEDGLVRKVRSADNLDYSQVPERLCELLVTYQRMQHLEPG